MCPTPTDHIAKSGEGGGIVDNVYTVSNIYKGLAGGRGGGEGCRLFDLFVTILAILDICSNESRGV
jgi:hypothetical protein